MIETRLELQLDGPTNMSRDSELFAKAELGTSGARVYSWDGIWVSLGLSQTHDRVLKTSAFQWVKRPTGGKAVLHGHDVTLGLAMSFYELGLNQSDSRSVKRVYRAIVPLIMSALAVCGFETCLGESYLLNREQRLTADCFAYVSANDIVLKQSGKKVCGCALKLGQNSVLVQASIPAGKPLVDPALVFIEPSIPNPIDLRHDDFFCALSSVLAQKSTECLCKSVE